MPSYFKAFHLQSSHCCRKEAMATKSVAEFLLMVALAVALALVRPAIGGITCENLPTECCAFSVSSAGTRCVLEKYAEHRDVKYECRSSDVLVHNFIDWVETDDCIEACGLSRKAIGISSDSLLEPKFTQKFCSPNCYQSCPNIVEMYFNLAAGEGVYLPKLCKMQAFESRRGMVEINSYGEAVAEPSESPTYEPPYWEEPDLNCTMSPMYDQPPYGEQPDVSPSGAPICGRPLHAMAPGPSPALGPVAVEAPMVTVPDPTHAESPTDVERPVGSVAEPCESPIYESPYGEEPDLNPTEAPIYVGSLPLPPMAPGPSQVLDSPNL